MSAQQDLAAIIAQAAQDPAVAAIGTEGALNDVALQADEWSDLDVTIFVKTDATIDKQAYITAFGAPVIVQHLLNQDMFGPSSAIWDTYLVRYAKTQRIDWKFAPAADIDAYLASDSLNTLVWQAGIGAVTPRATSAQTHAVQLPTAEEFADSVNELLWCAGNVAKGLHRQQLLYANEMLNLHVRSELLRLLAWQVALDHSDFDAGACYKHLPEALERNQRQMLANSYAQASLADTAHSLAQVLDLAEAASVAVANGCGYPVPSELVPALAQLRDWLG
ncbi:aminoglycoside 6-adenylyltransferase [Lacticaseibacillus jixiensis]|uniref:aminoglycoside 6-adenylyltransferase n=1 Tax=Lacticaseibacillus jixiensis TaxID=3231926 RepID=UPI0036F3EF54